MNSPINLINLNIATAVAAGFTIVASLAPQVADARPIVAISPSSRLHNGSQNAVSFDLENSVTNSNPNPNIGNYVGAVQNFLDIDLKDKQPTLSFASGNVMVSRIDAPTNLDALVPGPSRNFDFTFSDLINEPNIPGATNFENGGLRYEVTFDDNSNVTLTWFIPSTDPTLINSLSGVSQFDYVPGVVSRSSDASDDELFVNLNRYPQSNPLTFQPVPEPNGIAGILALGGLGAISILKRKMHSSIHSSNRKVTLSGKAGRAL